MGTENDFSGQYKDLSNTELLEILNNKSDYLPEALEAARNEWARRNLSMEAITAANEELNQKKEKANRQKEKIRAFETKVKEGGNDLLDTLNPIQAGIAPAEKIIRFIVIVFTIIFMYELLGNYELIAFELKYFKDGPFESAVVLLPFLLLPLAILLFRMKKRAGWHLLAAFLVFSLMVEFFTLFRIFTWVAPQTGNSGGFQFQFSDDLYRRPPVTGPVMRVLFAGATLFAIWRKNLREIFHVPEGNALLNMAASALVTFFLVYSVF